MKKMMIDVGSLYNVQLSSSEIIKISMDRFKFAVSKLDFLQDYEPSKKERAEELLKELESFVVYAEDAVIMLNELVRQLEEREFDE